jgi:3-oxoacyl-[acyl-carrier-protein] synthase II
LKVDRENRERIGAFISSGIGDFWAVERQHARLLRGSPGRIAPSFMRSALAETAAREVAIRNAIQGPTAATATACAAGNHAIGDSSRLIRDGHADVMICGGAESAITPMSIAGFAAMRALSTRNDDPERASRPFDLDRDGFVLGEGAGMMVLEDLEHARARSARIYAEIAGYWATADAYHMTAPDETQSGVTRVMRKTLDDAGIRPEQVDYINAHGTSTPLGDRGETLAVKKLFGAHSSYLALSSTKSMTGHLLGAAGGVEAVFTTLSIYHGTLPPTINYETPDPECDLDYVPNQPWQKAVEYAISNGFGFGGTNAALVFAKYQIRR